MIIAASGIDTTIFAAFAVGVVSFLSPCVLPLVPGYLSAISGLSFDALADREPGDRAKTLGPALLFCLSFTIVFVALGMSATGLGQTLRNHQQTLNTIAGWLIVSLGVFTIVAVAVPRLGRDLRPNGLIARAGSGGPIIAGLAFAIAWTPCVGPTLGAILAAASTSDSVGQGGVLLAFYGAGLAIPFLLTAVAFERAATVFAVIRRHHRLLMIASGLILIAMGLLILTGELTRLNSDAQRFLNDLGIDFLYRI